MIVSRSPHSGDVVAEIRPVSPSQVAALAEAARAAGNDWSNLAATVRAHALASFADALAADAAAVTDLIIREVGKPRREAAGEVARGVAILRYYAQQTLDPSGEVLPGNAPRAMIISRSRPRGIAGLITPWNFPLAIPLWKSAPALAYGNGVLLKPSSEAIGVAARLADLASVTLPAGLFALVPGGRQTAEAIIDVCDSVSFTGSTTVGQSVVLRGARRQLPCQAEMGGSNIAVIAPSADIKTAVKHVIDAAFLYAGQKCTATSHIIVVGGGRDIDTALVGAAQALTVEDPDSALSDSGPLINEEAAHSCADACAEALHTGAKVLTEVGARSEGTWQPLRLLTDVAAETRIAREEVFGPVATVIHVDSLDEAISRINSQSAGLVSSLHTNDLTDAFTFERQVKTGMIKLNAPTTGVDYWAPFGGAKDSSFGPREQGKAARHLYTTTQTITWDVPS